LFILRRMCLDMRIQLAWERSWNSNITWVLERICLDVIGWIGLWYEDVVCLLRIAQPSAGGGLGLVHTEIRSPQTLALLYECDMTLDFICSAFPSSYPSPTFGSAGQEKFSWSRLRIYFYRCEMGATRLTKILRERGHWPIASPFKYSKTKIATSKNLQHWNISAKLKIIWSIFSMGS
jgi:hypothetical protein